MVLTLPVPPTANLWWRMYRGRMVKSKAAREYQETAAMIALAARMPRFAKPIEVMVTVHWFRTQRRGDLDKRYSIMLDALQGIAYDNDSQIAEIHAYRTLVPENPRMEVIVAEHGMPT